METVRRVRKKTRQKLSKVKAATHEHKDLLWSIAIPIIFILFLILLLTKDMWPSAADSILRPLLGEKNTLRLEAVYFGVQDKVNAGNYALFGAKGLSDIPVVTPVKIKNADKMVLRNIPPDSSLPAVPNEGVWIPMKQDLFPGETVMAQTFIRPDATHPYAIAYLVKMDMRKVGIGAVAGTYYPGGAHKAYGPGMVPKSVQDAGILVAAFNGGFQEKDGGYGMVVGGKTYVPLKLTLPTLVLHTDGSVSFTMYSGQIFPANVAALRQNGPYLVENGRITPYVEQGNDTWGRTITNSIYTWRSGIGITNSGDVVYAAGNSLIPGTLAKVLKDAGAVNAIQLDINPPWVRFMTYQSTGNGQYTTVPLAPSMQGGTQYLRRYNKDLFYVYKK